MKPFQYTIPQVSVHWLTAALIVFLLVTGTFILSEIPNTTEKIGNLRMHMILGAVAAILIIARIVMRRRYPAPPPVYGERIAHIGHMALNIVALLLVFSGVVLSLQSGAFDAVFGSGVLPEDFHEFIPRKIHGLLSRVAMGLIALHFLAAIYHQFVLKDGLISQMSFRKRPK